MQINQSNLRSLYAGYRTIFVDAFHGAAPEWNRIAVETPSTSEKETYHWLGAVPGMKKLVGEITINNLTASNYTITNDEFEDTVGVKQTAIERDTYGIYNPLFTAMGAAAAEHPDELMSVLLLNGFTSKDYTGKNFFDTAKKHNTADAPTFDNKITDALDVDSFRAARTLLKSMKNSKGRPMNLGRKLTLIVPPALESTARQILNAELVLEKALNGSTVVGGAAVTNVDKGTAELWVWNRLAESETKWFLADLGQALKPLIYQLEQRPTLDALDDMSSDHVFKNHEFLYQAYGRYNAGYGLPQFIIGSTGAN